MTNLSQTLQELKYEDFIWIIYSFIVLGALISNVLQTYYGSLHGIGLHMVLELQAQFPADELSGKDSEWDFVEGGVFLVRS